MPVLAILGRCPRAYQGVSKFVRALLLRMSYLSQSVRTAPNETAEVLVVGGGGGGGGSGVMVVVPFQEEGEGVIVYGLPLIHFLFRTPANTHAPVAGWRLLRGRSASVDSVRDEPSGSARVTLRLRRDAMVVRSAPSGKIRERRELSQR